MASQTIPLLHRRDALEAIGSVAPAADGEAGNEEASTTSRERMNSLLRRQHCQDCQLALISSQTGLAGEMGAAGRAGGCQPVGPSGSGVWPAIDFRRAPWGTPPLRISGISGKSGTILHNGTRRSKIWGEKADGQR